jgi:GntR family transcriptional regulator
MLYSDWERTNLTFGLCEGKESMSVTAIQERTPAYKKIQNAILHRIEAGQLRPGDPVCSERELAKIHGVSLMTARHALAGLESEGRVERRRGAGTFVAQPRVHFNRLMSYTEQMSGRNLEISSRVLSFKVVQNEPEVALRLLLPADADLLKLERIRGAGDEPFAFETCYLSAAEFSSVQRDDLKRGSLFALVERKFGLEIAHADEEVDATLPDAALARFLEIGRDVPLLRIRQVIYSKQGKPLIYVLGLYRADRHMLHIRRFR